MIFRDTKNNCNKLTPKNEVFKFEEQILHRKKPEQHTLKKMLKKKEILFIYINSTKYYINLKKL